MWEAVFARMRPGLLSSEDEIARAEAALGFALPASFKAFATECGAGRIGGGEAGCVRIATPVPVEAADLVTRAQLIAHSVAAAIENLSANPLLGDAPHRFTIQGDALPESVASDDPGAELVARACFFGEAGNGAFLFWDVRPGAPEYDIWVLGADLETIRYGGPDLTAFVAGVRGLDAPDILGEGAYPLPSAFDGDDATALARLGAPGQDEFGQDASGQDGEGDGIASGDA